MAVQVHTFVCSVCLHVLCLCADDSTCDIPIDPLNMEQYIVWGVGPLERGEIAFQHFKRASGELHALVQLTV